MNISEISEKHINQVVSLTGVLEIDDTAKYKLAIALLDITHSSVSRIEVKGKIKAIFSSVSKSKRVKLSYPVSITGTVIKQDGELCLTNITYAKIELPNKFEPVGYKPLPFYLELKVEYGQFSRRGKDYSIRIARKWIFSKDDAAEKENIIAVDVSDVVQKADKYQNQWLAITGCYQIYRLFVDEADFENQRDYFFAFHNALKYETLVPPELWCKLNDTKESNQIRLENSIFLDDTYLQLLADIFLLGVTSSIFHHTFTVVGKLVEPWENHIQIALGHTQTIIAEYVNYGEN